MARHGQLLMDCFYLFFLSNTQVPPKSKSNLTLALNLIMNQHQHEFQFFLFTSTFIHMSTCVTWRWHIRHFHCHGKPWVRYWTGLGLIYCLISWMIRNRKTVTLIEEVSNEIEWGTWSVISSGLVIPLIIYENEWWADFIILFYFIPTHFPTQHNKLNLNLSLSPLIPYGTC